MDNVTYPHKSPSLKMCLGKQFQKSFCCDLFFVLMIALKVIKIHFRSNFLENYVFETEKTNGKWKGTKYHSVVCRSSVVAIQHWQARNNMLGNVSCVMAVVCKQVQQLSTTCNRVSKRMQHVTSNSVGSCWPTMLHPFAQGVIYVLHLRWYSK